MSSKYLETSSQTGIYAIKNIVDDRVYIGSTSDSFKRRWYNHKYTLGKNTHGNRHLQNSWNKHGEDAFEFSVIEGVDDGKLLSEREQYWIDYYTATDGGCYNILPANMCCRCDCVSRFNIRVTMDTIDEFDIIVIETGDAQTEIISDVMLHGLSLIWKLFDGCITYIGDKRTKLVYNKDEVVSKVAVDMDRAVCTTYTCVRHEHVVSKMVVIPDVESGYISKIAKMLSMDRNVLCQLCIAYALYTKDDMVQYRRSGFVDIIDDFYNRLYWQHRLFESLDCVIGDNTTQRIVRKKFDDFMERCNSGHEE
jgi:hypothetical protein